MESDESTGWSSEDGYGDPEPPSLDSGGGDSLSDPDLAYGGGEDDSDGLGADLPEGDPDPPEGDSGDPLADSASSGYGIDPDAEAGPDGGPGVSDELADGGPGPDGSGDAAADAPPGVDPDVDPVADDEAWGNDPFPESLDLDAPEPVDGMPWTDPTTLGAGEDQLGHPTADSGSAPVSDLYAYDGSEPPAGGDNSPEAWGALEGSDDPATSSLARYWGP